MGANNVSGHLISPYIISYILLKNITVLSLSFIICINVHRKTEMLIKSNYLDNIKSKFIGQTVLFTIDIFLIKLVSTFSYITCFFFYESI